MIFNMAVGILTPCNEAQSWHWFRQVTDCTQQCGLWLWNCDSEFTKWQHPAMWYVTLGWHAIEFAQWQYPAMWHVALESWHWICQVAAPCNVAGGSGMTRHLICPNVRHIGILLFWFRFRPHHRSRHALVFKIISKSDHPLQKKITSCRFSRWRISAILDFRGPIMGSLKSPCTTSYRSSIETITLNCLLLRKSLFCISATDRRTDGQAHCMKPLLLSRAVD